jgi:hypothetical protein
MDRRSSVGFFYSRKISTGQRLNTATIKPPKASTSLLMLMDSRIDGETAIVCSYIFTIMVNNSK